MLIWPTTEQQRKLLSQILQLNFHSGLIIKRESHFRARIISLDRKRNIAVRSFKTQRGYTLRIRNLIW